MAWHQHARTCDEHADCIAISCEDGETVAWVSHAHADEDAGVRANPEVPGTDWTGKSKKVLNVTKAAE